MLSEEAIFENGLNLGNQRLICFYLGTDNKYAKFHAYDLISGFPYPIIWLSLSMLS